MQIVINKVENGYICTKDGKMYIMCDLVAIAQFLATQFDDFSITKFQILKLPQENESITSDSSEV